METPVVVDTGANPQRAVVWLHGLGADGHDFEGIVQELTLPADYNVRFVFPHAPVQPVSINGGYRMRAWYDITESDLGRQVDFAGIKQSATSIAQLIQEPLLKQFSTDQIVLAGFSQGGVIALHLGLRHTSAFGGIMALSTYAPTAFELGREGNGQCRNTPIFWAHGTLDPVVSVTQAQQDMEKIRKWGCNPQWHTYPMPHSVCAQEVVDISRWLSALPSFSMQS